MNVKMMAKEVIDHLPDDTSLDEIIYALYLKAKFERGEREIRMGNGISHSKAKESLQKWIK